MRALMVVLVLGFVLAACNSTTAQRSFVPWLPLPRGNANITLPSPTAPVPVPPGTPLCSSAQLEARLLGTSTPVGFRNTGSAACYLNGVPDLKLFDAQGQVLASASGQGGVGTQLDEYIVSVDVLLQPGTPELSAESFNGTESLAAGQAVLNVAWIGCSAEPAARLLVDLPGGGGTLAVDYAVAAPEESTCVYAPSDQLIRDPLKPTGVVWPPPPHRVSVQFTVDSPKTAKAGSTIEFFVTIRNTTSTDDYVLNPCPDYSEALVPGGPVTYYQLNCGPVGAIRAGKAVTFQMKFAIPSSTPKGPWLLQFGLVDGRQTPPGVQTPITIT